MKKKTMGIIYGGSAMLIIVCAVLRMLQIIPREVFWLIVVIESAFITFYQSWVIGKLHQQLENKEKDQ